MQEETQHCICTPVAVLGTGHPILAGSGSRAVDVYSSAHAYFADVQVVNGSGSGVFCEGSSVWVDDSEVRNNSQAGFNVSGGCEAHLRRTTVNANNNGAITASNNGTHVHVQNSAIVGNTNPNGVAAILLQTGADIEIAYSTVVNNWSGVGDPGNLVCSGASSGFVRNTIVIGSETNSISGCAGVDFDYNALDTAGLGGTNDSSFSWNANWFSDPAEGEVLLTAAGAEVFEDIAQWQPGDPLTDVEGNAIPTETPSYPGYHQPE